LRVVVGGHFEDAIELQLALVETQEAKHRAGNPLKGLCERDGHCHYTDDLAVRQHLKTVQEPFSEHSVNIE